MSNLTRGIAIIVVIAVLALLLGLFETDTKLAAEPQPQQPPAATHTAKQPDHSLFAGLAKTSATLTSSQQLLQCQQQFPPVQLLDAIDPIALIYLNGDSSQAVINYLNHAGQHPRRLALRAALQQQLAQGHNLVELMVQALQFSEQAAWPALFRWELREELYFAHQQHQFSTLPQVDGKELSEFIRQLPKDSLSNPSKTALTVNVTPDTTATNNKNTVSSANNTKSTANAQDLANATALLKTSTLRQSRFFGRYSQTFQPYREELSASMYFMAFAKPLTLTQFQQQLQQYQVTVEDINLAIKTQLSLDKINWLLEQVASIDTALFTASSTVYNLADQAIYEGRLDVLQLLQQRQLQPTYIAGLISPLDLIFTASQFSSFELPSKQQLQTLIVYLQQQGYPLHATMNASSGQTATLKVGSQYQQQVPIDQNWLLELAQQQVFLSPTSALPVAAALPPELQQALQKFTQANQQLLTDAAACQQQLSADLAAQQLWSKAQIQAQLDAFNADPTADPAELAAIDPMLWQAWHDSQSVVTEDTYATPQLNVVEIDDDDLSQWLQWLAKNQLTPGQSELLLNSAIYRQKLWPAWQLAGAAVPPISLSFFKHLPLSYWQQLRQLGFDFTVVDIHGQGLYPQAFVHSAAAVQFLLDARVPISTGLFQIDALSLALDHSYLQRSLHPATATLLNLPRNLNKAQLSRLKRLALYQPELFAELLTLRPGIALPDGLQPNPLLSLAPSSKTR